MAQKFIGVTLPIRMGQTGMFESSVNLVQQTKSNFVNLILTKKGERLHQAELGCDLWKILFEPITEETIENARLSVLNAVSKWMDYLEIVDFNVTANENTNTLSIRCSYAFKNNPNVTDSVEIYTTEANTLAARFESPFNQGNLERGGTFTTATGQQSRRRVFKSVTST